MRQIAILNQKGGVGKTTTVLNLARALTELGYCLALVDGDPQGHLTASLCGPSEMPGLAEMLLTDDQNVTNYLTRVNDLDLLPMGHGLDEIVENGRTAIAKGNLERLKSSLQDKDFLLVDCPPALNWLVRDLLRECEEVMIPVASDFLALQGLSVLLTSLRKLEAELSRKFIYHIVVTRYHQRRRLSNEVLDTVISHFPGQVCQTKIRECVAIAEAPGFSQSVLEYSPNSNGAIDYRALAEDVLRARYD